MTDFINLQDSLVQACLPTLLKDKTTKKNIVFATDSYAALGDEFHAECEINLPLLVSLDLQPRILKSREEQAQRTKSKAEVFTPAWLCCKMNNHCDDEWFGVTDVFNHMEGETWEPTIQSIEFPEGKDWKQYVDSRRLEITCGEAPYVVSRYDTATGEPINIKKRVGILDRKIRVVNENTFDKESWLKWALRAFQSVYGYECQGDSLLIARINMLLTFIEYYKDRFGEDPADKDLLSYCKAIANVIAWNFWQMDGLTGCMPYFEVEPVGEPQQLSLFDTEPQQLTYFNDASFKTIPCLVYDWRAREPIFFNNLKKGT